MFQLGDVELCLGGLNPPKHPRGDGTAWAALSKSVKFLNTNSNTATKNIQTRNPTCYGVHQEAEVLRMYFRQPASLQAPSDLSHCQVIL